MQVRDVIVITGANAGLGLEIVKALCQSEKRYDVVIGSRDMAKGEEAMSALRNEFPNCDMNIHVVQMDVCSDESIIRASETILANHGRVDILVNNAGAGFDLPVQQGKLSIREAWNMSWDVNVTGAHFVTTQFAPLLLESANPRLLFMTSGASPLAETEAYDNPIAARLNASPAGGWPKEDQILPLMSYRSTKTGLNMMMREWNRILRDDGVKVWAVSPGFLVTGLGDVGSEQLGKLGAKHPSNGGRFVRDVIEGAHDDNVGKAIRHNGVQPW